MSTWRGYDRPVPPETAFYTYPGPGRTGVPTSESTAENPFTPAQLLGLKNPTGPHLYVLPFGGAAQKAVPAALVGPAGPVDVRIADSATSDGTRSLGGYIPDSSLMLIPPAPLAPEATFTATVTFASGLVHSWSFTTLPLDNTLSIGFAAGRSALRTKVRIDSPAPVLEAWAIAPDGKRTALGASGGEIPNTLGRWKACARSGGPGTGYFAAERCASRTVPARWYVDVTKRGRRLTLRASDYYTRGRTATVSWQRGY